VRAGSTQAQRATNSGLNADLANAAQQVFGNTYPDSGTAARLWQMVSLNSALAGGSSYAFPGVALPIGALTSLMYGTPAARKAMFAALAKRPDVAKLFGEAVQKAAPQAGLIAGALGN
jgi:hypothetical protein